MDLEKPFLHDIASTDHEFLRDQISKMEGSMVWLTRPAQVHCQDPRYGLILGLARTVRHELMMDFFTVELEHLNSASVSSVVGIVTRTLRDRAKERGDTDTEFAIHDGVVLTGRYHWGQFDDELKNQTLADDSPCKLVSGSKASLDSLHWLQHEEQTLGADEVEVDMCYVSLNFRDLVVAMGLMDEADRSLGLDGSGIVRRVGDQVGHVRPGDQVMVMAPSALANRLTCHGQLVHRLPRQLGLEDAATMPVVFLTAIQALINTGQLTKGKSVLIHSACGGVGLAAMQLCRMVQADLYVTAGNDNKVKHLMDQHQVPRDRIFNSRDASFVDGIMRSTGGRGVDVVLNSLTGSLLHASWACVARHGKMLELGKIDFRGRGQLAMEPFEANRSFHGIDLFQMCLHDHDMVQGLMKQLVRYHQAGHISPIRPVEVFAASRVTDALRHMQKGLHMGKIVISIPQDLPATIPVVKPQRRISLSATGCYLVVGGIDGLGKVITRWMVERGARNFVFLSRSAGKQDQHQLFFRELQSQGCQAIAVAGSVADMSHVQRAIDLAPAPIVGVLHMAMVLKDAAFSNVTFEDWNAVLEPKVKGTWNLHKAFLGTQLDFFLLAGSVVALCGNVGQTCYAAANSFLDSFVQYRHANGLPCSVIDIGNVGDAGFSYQNSLQASGTNLLSMMHKIYERDLVNAFELAIYSSPPTECKFHGLEYSNKAQLAVGIDWKSDSTAQYIRERDRRMCLSEQFDNSTADSGDHGNDRSLKDLLVKAASRPECLMEAENMQILIDAIAVAICSLMGWFQESLDVSKNLSSEGLDSLVGIEVRNWFVRELGVEINVLQILKQGSIVGMARLAAQLLCAKHGKGNDSKGS
ncbi:hypothetical protein CDD82_7419 [Ophiocordyceps australis]|uniref:Carrier domain-containing protein n=1 Tax=Ophiocordyceps australis TaxID=1399860 RepID=A0A2C5YSS5_9HYPO|nr:hypothetical protein CDD82_7419 [Ophiocordyceps australis]